jgi:tRNA 2-thiouridine synthesizing protein A
MTTPTPLASDPPFDVEWDAGELGCGELLLKLRVRLRGMPGQVMRVTTRDPGAIEDIPSYCRVTGHPLLHAEPARGLFWIRAKG